MRKIIITVIVLAFSIKAQSSSGKDICVIGVHSPMIPVDQPHTPLQSLPPYPKCPENQQNSAVKPFRCQEKPLSNKFTLSLSYACRPKIAFQSCLGEVVWNNAIVQSIVPNDYKFKNLNIEVTIQAGKNVLQLVGAGISDSYGLLIDNVKLVRKGTSNNIVVNGDFLHPNIGDTWGLFNNILGWKGKQIQIGNGQKSPYGIGNKQLCQLDGNSNYQMSQEFTFNNLYQQIQNEKESCETPLLKYNLEFDWAIRQSYNRDSSKANVLWNNVVIISLQANKDNQINHESLTVDLKQGDNLIQFDGTSFSDKAGITIDNVKLTSKYNNTNLVVNGDFSEPSVGSGWSYFGGGIPGWSALTAEVGYGNLYHSKWRTGQVIELDSDLNQRYTQTIKIPAFLYSQLVKQSSSLRRN